MEDTTAEVVEIQIRADGEVVWVNTEEGCVLRICRVKGLHIDDQRLKSGAGRARKRYQEDLFYDPKLPKISGSQLPELK